MSRIVLNRTATRNSAREKGQEVALALSTKVLIGAKTLVRQGSHRHGSGRPVAGPSLKNSLQSVRVNVNPLSIVYDVGSPLDYAASMHQGSRPHQIRATSKPLSFFWPRARFQGRGRRLRTDPRVAFMSVRHPGNKRPNRFLTTPLHQFGRAAGFIVRTQSASRSFLP